MELITCYLFYKTGRAHERRKTLYIITKSIDDINPLTDELLKLRNLTAEEFNNVCNDSEEAEEHPLYKVGFATGKVVTLKEINELL